MAETHTNIMSQTLRGQTVQLKGAPTEVYEYPQVIMGVTGAGAIVPIQVAADGTLPFTATLTTGDIEIGAVELKNSDTDARANILPANTARTTGTIVLATQSIDAAGAVLSTSALATSAKQPAVTPSLNTGVMDAGTQRVTLATDGPGVSALATIATNTGAATPAGANIIGKVSIDQTVDGTTNLVAAKQSGTSYIVSGLAAVGAVPTLNPLSISGLDGGGLKRHVLTNTAGNLDVVSTQLHADLIAATPTGANVIGGVTVANGSDAALGATTDAAVGDATGSVNAHVRNLSKVLPMALGSGAASGGLLVTQPFAQVTSTISSATTSAALNTQGVSSIACNVTTVAYNPWQLEGTRDGTNWVAVQAAWNESGAPLDFTVGPTGASRRILALNAGYQQMRVSVISYASGTVTVTLSAIQGLTPLAMVALAGQSQSEGNYSAPSMFASANDLSAGAYRPLATAQIVSTGAAPNSYLRTPNIFKTVSATASGNTSLWAGTSAKKHRIMRLKIDVTADAATASGADIVIDIQDVTTTTNLTHTVFVPAVAGTVFGNGYSSGWIDLGNGILCAAANTAVNVNLSAALTSGVVRVIVAGTDE